MEEKPQETPEQPEGEKPRFRFGPNFWIFAILLVALAAFFLSGRGPKRSRITYDFFIKQLEQDNIAEVNFSADNEVKGKFREPPPEPPETDEDREEYDYKTDGDGEPILFEEHFQFTVSKNLSDEGKKNYEALLKKHDVAWDNTGESQTALIFTLLVYLLLPIGLFIFLFFMFRRTRDQIMGGGFLSGFSKSPAQRYEPNTEPVTFKDVAGLKSVKEDLSELIEFLKDPAKFQRLGGRVPKGVLLLGPPGTGKTLLARAVAGEAGVPFFSVSGSEFIQMFVGVGASRVRDLFKTAKDNAPSILFIDEIDAVGRQRGAGLGGGHDEREQTLNQILSAMDGFTPTEAVIVLAATNRPDVLDPALLRPGRFDRHVTVDRPTLKGREEIFKVHVRDVPLADDVDLARLAAGTVGLTGADIRNMVNEAALWATRHDKNCVDMDDFEHARDKILMGPKREDVLLEKEKEKTACHEAGHALIAWLTPGVDRVHKVTVIPRGRSLGATQTLPEEDKMNYSESDLHNRLMVYLGGRAAEKLVYDEYSVGADNDLERATKLARRMVTQWGMSERLGPVNCKITAEDPFLGREMHEHRQFSEHTMQVIDEEVAKILRAASDRAGDLIAENRGKLDKLMAALVEEEEVDDKEITVLIGPSVHEESESEERAGSSEIAAKETVRKTDV